MRVALLRNMPQERFTSIEVYGDRLAAGLRALGTGDEFVEVQVEAWRWPGLRLPTPYGRPASLATLGLYLSRWVRYPLALRRVRADVYHILDNSYGHLAFFLDPRRTVATFHGGTPRGYRRWNPKGPALWVFDLAFRGMQRAARIVAVSECAGLGLLAEAHYASDRVHVVRHGVDPCFRPLAASQRARRRAALLQPGDQYLLLHVGHSKARKNVEVLYHAAALLRQGGRAVRLLRVGGLPTPAQSALIDSLGIREAVTHVAHVPNGELPGYYGAADAFVFPSLYEGFGVPLIEAMACGAPVVCSDIALFREVCGDAARLADPHEPEAMAEAIAQVLGDRGFAADLRSRGLARAQLYTWERAAKETLAVYHQMQEELV